MPALNRKAQGWNKSPEDFLSAYVENFLESEDETSQNAETNATREALEDILEERDKGPFITITDTKALKERVMARALARVQSESLHS